MRTAAGTPARFHVTWVARRSAKPAQRFRSEEAGAAMPPHDQLLSVAPRRAQELDSADGNTLVDFKPPRYGRGGLAGGAYHFALGTTFASAGSPR
jgi:hypothetical protein